MKCPFCRHKELKVIDSREFVETNAIRRRRECLECLRRFTTFETIELVVQVLKRDGTYEDFQIEKLIKGLDAACRHTTISHAQVIAIASQVKDEFMNRPVLQVSTTELGEVVMKKLQSLDPIAYIRFACVYRRLKDINELMEAIQLVKSKDEEKVKQELIENTAKC